MKKFNRILMSMVIGYVLFATAICIMFLCVEQREDHAYRVDINRFEYTVMNSDAKTEDEIDSLIGQADSTELSIRFQTINETSSDILEKFYETRDNYQTVFHTLDRDGHVIGIFRYDIPARNTKGLYFFTMEAILFILFLIIMGVLFYVKHAVMKPFHTLSELPYELSKGHFSGELKENKGKYFGKFVWGISMLRDELEAHRQKEMKLEKEKKMLLLSLSHDIKTPLNAIKLYARALEESIYDSEAERIKAVQSIQKHCTEIDGFVEEIVKSSSENILKITVNKGEFYVSSLMERIEETYKDKCRMRMIDLEVDSYENRLVSGDFDRVFEVIENLFVNAFKYGDGRRIHISFSEQDYCQLIHIFNTGAVLKQEEVNHIFDSFYRGSNATNKEGNGLGLYICREIMRKCEGEIFAEIKKDGMCFTLVLS